MLMDAKFRFVFVFPRTRTVGGREENKALRTQLHEIYEKGREKGSVHFTELFGCDPQVLVDGGGFSDTAFEIAFEMEGYTQDFSTASKPVNRQAVLDVLEGIDEKVLQKVRVALGLDESKRWAVFCKHCGKEWSVPYEYSGESVCDACKGK